MRWEIQALGQRLAAAANAEESLRRKGSKSHDKAQHERELKQINQAIRKLLTRIEDAVPLINLAITASGASLSSTLPTTVSPSRLLQASTFLTAGDSQYGASSSNYVQIGPTFTLSMYMLFLGHLRPQNEEDVRESTWKEVIHKADVRLMRVPINALYDMPEIRQQVDPLVHSNRDDCPSPATEDQEGDFQPTHMEAQVRADEYAYQLVIVEDLDDDRVHTFEDDEPQPDSYGDVAMAGIREVVPIHELSKIFYADTGKILNIGREGEANNPILLLKRDPNAVPPRRMMNQMGEDGEQDHDADDVNGLVSLSESQGKGNGPTTELEHVKKPFSRSPSPSAQLTNVAKTWRLPPDLDPEWIAFEVYNEPGDSDSESEAELNYSKPAPSSRPPSMEPNITSALSRLKITPSVSPSPQPPTPQHHQQRPRPSLPPIRTSLSLLETLLRLLSLQQFQQTPHLSIPDELLTFFLSESASTGAASNDVQERKRLREAARRRVGFDPYDESPVKRRGEEYQYRGGAEGSPSAWDGEERYSSESGFQSTGYEHDEGYGTKADWTYRSPRTPRDGMSPQTPQFLLKSRSRSGTPEQGLKNSPGRNNISLPPVKWSPGRRELAPGNGITVAGRKESPLARPGTGVTDEGFGTSPVSTGTEEEK